MPDQLLDDPIARFQQRIGGPIPAASEQAAAPAEESNVGPGPLAPVMDHFQHLVGGPRIDLTPPPEQRMQPYRDYVNSPAGQAGLRGEDDPNAGYGSFEPGTPTWSNLNQRVAEGVYNTLRSGGGGWLRAVTPLAGVGDWNLRQLVPYAGTAVKVGEAFREGLAQRRQAAGQDTPADRLLIAQGEGRRQMDAEEDSTNAGFATRKAANVVQFLGELVIAGGATSPLSAGIRGLAGTSLAGRGLAAAGTAALSTLGTPSMWAEQAVRNNNAAGRDPADIAGFPGPLGLAWIQNLIFQGGLLSNQATRIPGAGAAGYLARGAARTGGQFLEQGFADAVTSALAQNVSYLHDLDTHYGTIGKIVQAARGQGDAGDATKHAVADILTFAIFAGLHARSDAAEAAMRRPLGPGYDHPIGPTQPGHDSPIGPVKPGYDQPSGPTQPTPTPTPTPRPSTTPHEVMDAARDFLNSMAKQRGVSARVAFGMLRDVGTEFQRIWTRYPDATPQEFRDHLDAAFKNATPAHRRFFDVLARLVPEAQPEAGEEGVRVDVPAGQRSRSPAPGEPPIDAEFETQQPARGQISAEPTPAPSPPAPLPPETPPETPVPRPSLLDRMRARGRQDVTTPTPPEPTEKLQNRYEAEAARHYRLLNDAPPEVATPEFVAEHRQAIADLLEAAKVQREMEAARPKPRAESVTGNPKLDELHARLSDVRFIREKLARGEDVPDAWFEQAKLPTLGEIGDAANWTPVESHVMLELAKGRSFRDIGRDPEVGKDKPGSVEWISKTARQKAKISDSMWEIIKSEHAEESRTVGSPESIGAARSDERQRAAQPEPKTPEDVVGDALLRAKSGRAMTDQRLNRLMRAVVDIVGRQEAAGRNPVEYLRGMFPGESPESLTTLVQEANNERERAKTRRGIRSTPSVRRLASGLLRGPAAPAEVVRAQQVAPLPGQNPAVPRADGGNAASGHELTPVRGTDAFGTDWSNQPTAEGLARQARIDAHLKQHAAEIPSIEKELLDGQKQHAASGRNPTIPQELARQVEAAGFLEGIRSAELAAQGEPARAAADAGPAQHGPEGPGAVAPAAGPVGTPAGPVVAGSGGSVAGPVAGTPAGGAGADAGRGAAGAAGVGRPETSEERRQRRRRMGHVDLTGAPPAVSLWQAIQDEWHKAGGGMFPAMARLSHDVADRASAHANAGPYGRAKAEEMKTMLGVKDAPEAARRYVGAMRAEMYREHAEGVYRERAAKAAAAEAAAKSQYERFIPDSVTGRALKKDLDKAEALRKHWEGAAERAAGQKWNFVGPDAPFKSQAEFEAFRDSPMGRGLIDRLKQVVTPVSNEIYNLGKGHDADAEAQDGTQIKDFPVNMKRLSDEEATARDSGDPVAQRRYEARRGNMRNVLQKTPGLTRESSWGSENGYETDVSKQIDHLMSQYKDATRTALDNTMVANGVAVQGTPGASGENKSIRGVKGVEFDTKRSAPGGKITLHVDPRIAGEYRDLLEVDRPTSEIVKAAKSIGQILTTGSTLGAGEPTAHISNLVTMLFLPRTVRGLVETLRMSPEARAERLMQLLKEGMAKEHGFDSTTFDAMASSSFGASAINFAQEGLKAIGKIPPFSWSGKAIEGMDHLMRLAADKAFDSMVASKLVEDTPVGRRNFINQTGQYNKAAQSRIVVKLRDYGINPFATAFADYFVQGFRKMFMNPGVPAKSVGAAAQLRGEMLIKQALFLGAGVMGLNLVLWRNPLGDDETPFGAIKIWKTPDGRTIYLDVGRFSGLTRGLRQSGAASTIRGLRRGDKAVDIFDAAAHDAAVTPAHLFTGPALNTAATAATGRDMLGHDVAGRVHAGDTGLASSQTARNLIAAGAHATPLTGAIAERVGARPGTAPGVGESVAKALGAFGWRYSPLHRPKH